MVLKGIVCSKPLRWKINRLVEELKKGFANMQIGMKWFY